MLEAKKRLLISRSLLMFRIRFCPRENLGKAFSRKSLFLSLFLFFFLSFYHFQMIKVEGLGVYKYETRVFLCHTHPAQPQRCVRVSPLSVLSSWTLREQKRPDEGRRLPAARRPPPTHAASFKDFTGKDCF